MNRGTYLKCSPIPFKSFSLNPLELMSLDNMNFLFAFSEFWIFESVIDYVLISFFLLLLFVVFYLLRLKRKRLIREDQEKLAQYRIYGFFSSVLFEENVDENVLNRNVDKLKKKIPFHKTWCKELLIENIIDLDKNLKGDQKGILIKIYLKLGLYTYMNGLLMTGKWYYVSKALYYWRELGHSPSSKAIYPLVKHRNMQIRTAALLAYISLSDKDPLKILEDYADFISPIDEIKLLDIIQRKKIKKPLQIGEWLDFNIPSHVGFVLKLVAYYNALEFAPKVIELLDSPHEYIRLSAIDTIGKLLLSDSESKLIQIFPKESEIIQTKIINVLGLIGSENAATFLEELIRNPYRSEILLAIMRALKDIGSSFFENSFEDEPKLKSLKSHVLDPHI